MNNQKLKEKKWTLYYYCPHEDEVLHFHPKTKKKYLILKEFIAKS